MSDASGESRTERDLLGELEVPSGALHGIHTARAMDAFAIAGEAVDRDLVMAMGNVKLACARVNRELGAWPDARTADAIEQACREMAGGKLRAHITVDALQGGAGTLTNMNVNEVIANRALQLLGRNPGDYSIVSPHNDVNRHQSTNDTYPTALRLAGITGLRRLEAAVVSLQEAFQAKEKEFAHIVIVGRTEMQDAVLVTLGRQMGAYAEALNRDRWRIYKCEERLRVVNLGGTAVGTGIGAPREYIFKVVDELRALTGIGFARAENLLDATQNADVFVEVSGILKACAATLLKICGDLRLMASQPFGEITLPAVAAGSTIMPGKINPVVPEAVAHAAMMVIGNDTALNMAAASGNLQLNQSLPLIAHCLLKSIGFLERACLLFESRCVSGITANEERCRKSVDSAMATATVLVPVIGYERATDVAKRAGETGASIESVVVSEGIMSRDDFRALITPEAVCRLGSPSRSEGAH